MSTRAAVSGGTKAVTRAPSFSHLAQPGPKLTRAAAPSSAAKRLIVRPFATVSSVSGPKAARSSQAQALTRSSRAFASHIFPSPQSAVR